MDRKLVLTLKLFVLPAATNEIHELQLISDGFL